VHRCTRVALPKEGYSCAGEEVGNGVAGTRVKDLVPVYTATVAGRQVENGVGSPRRDPRCPASEGLRPMTTTRRPPRPPGAARSVSTVGISLLRAVRRFPRLNVEQSA
jgi:hypothetical protein